MRYSVTTAKETALILFNTVRRKPSNPSLRHFTHLTIRHVRAAVPTGCFDPWFLHALFRDESRDPRRTFGTGLLVRSPSQMFLTLQTPIRMCAHVIDVPFVGTRCGCILHSISYVEMSAAVDKFIAHPHQWWWTEPVRGSLHPRRRASGHGPAVAPS